MVKNSIKIELSIVAYRKDYVMKRNIVYLLTLILVSTTLAGCGSGSSNASYAKEDSFAEAAYATDDVYASSGYADYE